MINWGGNAGTNGAFQAPGMYGSVALANMAGQWPAGPLPYMSHICPMYISHICPIHVMSQNNVMS